MQMEAVQSWSIGRGAMPLPRPLLVLHGAPRLLHGDHVFLLDDRKSHLLLLHLSLFHDRARARDQLAGMLWPEVDNGRALHSLRQALSEVRRVLEPVAPDALVTGRTHVTLRTTQVDVDIARIEELLIRPDSTSLTLALHLAEADLLEGLDEEWVTTYRRHEDAAIREAGIEGARLLLATDDAVKALHVCRGLLRRDRADETVHRLALRCYAEMQDHSGLIRQYRDCVAALRDEVDAEPARETLRLYGALRESLEDVAAPM